MITHIGIRDFAIIAELDIDLSPGLTVVTGETGAGKSILIEAVSLALGSRADTSMIRAGRSKAVIQIVAELRDAAGEPSEWILTREISATGKSVARINGEIVTLAQLSELAARLADIHGQYDRHSLFKIENHLALTDAYKSRDTAPAKRAVADAWHAYAEAKRALSALLRTEAASARQRDFMRFELDEIAKADPKPGEDAALRESLAVLQNGELIYEKTAAAAEALRDGDRSAMDGLGTAMHALRELSAYSRDLDEIARIVADAYYAVEDAAGALRALRERMDFSPEALNNAIARLDLIERLCGKYGGSVAKMLEYKETLAATLADIESIDERKAALTARTRACEDALVRACEALHAIRRTAADELETRINAELAALRFGNAVFAVRFDDAGDIRQRLSENGADSVEFLIASNKGQAPLPLARIASGGEMSRILLAFKSVIGDYDDIPTMIFDEIDSGISGITAGTVGRKLVKMAEKRQILCITHLPQIAACGAHHFAIRKSDDGESTRTSVEALDAEERILEIARLIGGARITETTLKSARELIEMSAAGAGTPPAVG
ncbi:MAG: DNA repair protein RecN [Clostridiales Family XIII bacterium]|jgi:DNA repair protein RecN (Recombination protein N)|nr:DNA repair protein RecN [Clostridiales Family XIII bacterium]